MEGDLSQFDAVTPSDLGLLVSLLALAVVVSLGSFWELRERRIPNWLTLGGMGAGLALGYLPGGASLVGSVGGLVVGFGVLFAFYLFGGMGGGDVKLMGAAGALVGYPLILSIVMYSALIGGLMAILVLIWKRDLWAGVGRSLKMLVSFGRSPRRDEGAPSPGSVEATTIPYGIAIAIGCLLALLLGR